MIRHTSIGTHRRRPRTRRASRASRRDFIGTPACSSQLQHASSLLEPALAAGQAPARGRRTYPDRTSTSSTRGSPIRPDNTATFFVGKTDLGQGLGTAFRQIMADRHWTSPTPARAA
jgi:hypothetical protein